MPPGRGLARSGLRLSRSRDLGEDKNESCIHLCAVGKGAVSPHGGGPPSGGIRPGATSQGCPATHAPSPRVHACAAPKPARGLGGPASRGRRASSWRPPTLGAPSGRDAPLEARAWVRGLAAACLVLLGMRFTLPQSLQVGFVVALRHVAGLVGPPALSHGGARSSSGWGSWPRPPDCGWASPTPPTTRPTRPRSSPGRSSSWAPSSASACSSGVSDVLTSPSRRPLGSASGWRSASPPSTPLFATNPWKFGFALPVTVILLALAARFGRRWELGALTVLIVVAALSDSRSAFGLLLLAATAGLRADRDRPPAPETVGGRRRPRTRPARGARSTSSDRPSSSTATSV